jgi:hypothetical protein
MYLGQVHLHPSEHTPNAENVPCHLHATPRSAVEPNLFSFSLCPQLTSLWRTLLQEWTSVHEQTGTWAGGLESNIRGFVTAKLTRSWRFPQAPNRETRMGQGLDVPRPATPPSVLHAGLSPAS